MPRILSLVNRVRKSKLVIVGIILTIFSYYSFFIPTQYININTLSLLLYFFVTGIVLLCEGVTRTLKSKSLLKEIFRSFHNLLVFVIISTVGAIALELIVHWLGKLWIYPGYPGSGLPFYLTTFIPPFVTYWILIVESYLATKAIFDYFHKGKYVVRKYFRFEPVLYKILAVIGGA